MKTLHTDFTNDNKGIKGLFQELFLIQIQLEKLKKERFQFSKEIRVLIKVIDQLMEFLIELYAFFND